MGIYGVVKLKFVLVKHSVQGMVVSARHMGVPLQHHAPLCFDTYMLSEPAEAQWILRTDPYAPDEEGGEARPDRGCSQRRKHSAAYSAHGGRMCGSYAVCGSQAGAQGDGPVCAGGPARGLACARGDERGRDGR